MRIFLTGGAGYIGSHTLLEVLSQDHEVCVYDDFSNSAPEGLRRVAKLTNRYVENVEGDILDRERIGQALVDFRPDVVVHFAGKKAVGESTTNPLMYYRCNVEGTLSLLEGMELAGCDKIVFSSSATVYGDAQYLPCDETHPRAPTNPYGMTKYMVELILNDWCAANSRNAAILLRYFNPVGAHKSGEIGEDPHSIPNNLFPFVSQVAVGRLEKLQIFGSDYSTPDGTGVRDYIHVVDLAKAHAAAISYVQEHQGCQSINVGTGRGSSVLEVVKMFEATSRQKIPYEIVGRRAGDIASSYADVSKAKSLLGWSAERNLEDMCSSAWKWQGKNPNGYS